MKFLKQIYTGIDNNLKKAVTDGKLEAYYLDWDFGQLEEETNPPVSFPTVLIDVQKGQEFELNGRTTQQGSLTINVKVAFNVNERASSISTKQDLALEHLDKLQVIYETIGGTANTCHSQLYLTRFNRLPTRSWLTYELEFGCTVYTAYGQPYTLTPASGLVELEFEN